jgi:hypothetical protein
VTVADEQRIAEELARPGERVRDRRLRDAEPPRRARRAALLERDREDVEQVEVDAR